MRQCPKCKTSDYNNRNFCLMINICGHSICKNCVESLFSRNSAPCPTCGVTLKKQQYWAQQFDDPKIEKELYYRKNLKKVYNLLEDDFPDLRSYNQYLEDFESIIFNLTNDRDVTETRAKIDEFAKTNKDKIEANKGRKSADDIFIASVIEDETKASKRLQLIQKSEQEIQNKKITENDVAERQKTILDQLISSDAPAEVIVGRQKKNVLEQQEHETVTTAGVDNISKSRRLKRKTHLRAHKPFVYHYTDTTLAPELPGQFNPIMAPHMSQIGAYSQHSRESLPVELAGGFIRDIAVSCCLNEALCALTMRLVDVVDDQNETFNQTIEHMDVD